MLIQGAAGFAQEVSIEEACTSVAGAGSLVCSQALNTTSFDQAVPQSPAFIALGVTPQQVVRPVSPSHLVTSILNGADPNGNLQTGLAIDTNPYMLLAGEQVTLATYQESYVVRFLANTQLSLATTKGAEDADESVRLALGFHFTPWTDSDPRLDQDHLDCLGEAVSNFAEPTPPRPGASDEEMEEHKMKMLIHLNEDLRRSGLDRDGKSCHEEFREKSWNASGLTLGISPTWFSRSGELDNLDSSGVALWSSLALKLPTSGIPGLENIGQFIVHVRYRTDEEIPDTENVGEFIEQDTALVAGRLRLGRPTFNISGEGTYVHADRQLRENDDYLRWAASTEIRITESIWFEITVSGSSGRDDGDETALLGSIKWNLFEKSELVFPD
jgi:hypothetical protein